MDYNTNGIKIKKPASAQDAYEGGLHVTRDTTNAVGGTPGHVNVGLYAYTIGGKDVKAFEWNALFLLDNYATGGENCGFYAQANTHSTGGTWGGCIEVCDADVPSKNAPMRSLEVDVGASGPDNGQRYGIHLVVSDGPMGRKGIRTAAQATYAIYAGASWGTDWARWMYGIELNSYVNAGLHMRGGEDVVRGIHIEGKHIVTLDLSGSEDQTSIRMKAGQRICFDGYDDISLSWINGRLTLTNRHVGPIFEINTTTGDIYKRGVKVL